MSEPSTYTLMTVAQQEDHRERIAELIEFGEAYDRAALRFALSCIDDVMDRHTEQQADGHREDRS